MTSTIDVAARLAEPRAALAARLAAQAGGGTALLLPVGPEGTSLTEDELRVVQGASDEGEALTALLGLTAAITYKVACEMGGAGGPREDLVADRAVVRALLDLVRDVRLLARNQGAKTLLAVAGPLERRLELLERELDGRLGDEPGPDAEERPQVLLPVRAADFQHTFGVRRAEPREPRRGRRGRRARGAGARMRAPGANALVGWVAGLAASASLVYLGFTLWPLMVEEPPRPLETTVLEKALPGVQLVRTAGGEVELQVDELWLKWSDAVRYRRVFDTAAVLADHGYTAARLLDRTGAVVARWEGGRIGIGDTVPLGAPPPS